MKIFCIEMGNKNGTIAVDGVADAQARTSTFQAVVNGMTVYESVDYESAREVALAIFDLHKTIQRNSN